MFSSMNNQLNFDLIFIVNFQQHDKVQLFAFKFQSFIDDF